MITLKDAEHNLKHKRPFLAGNLYAVGVHDPLEDEFIYTVFSYTTAIARFIDSPSRPSTWLTDEKYSQTTSKHLNIVKRAWGLN